MLNSKKQVINSKREILSFDNEKEELGIKQKKKLKEFANIIKNKPVKIIIKTFLSKEKKILLNIKEYQNQGLFTLEHF